MADGPVPPGLPAWCPTLCGGWRPGAGKDATEDFEEIGHSRAAKEMLTKYYIGEFAVRPIIVIFRLWFFFEGEGSGQQQRCLAPCSARRAARRPTVLSAL